MFISNLSEGLKFSQDIMMIYFFKLAKICNFLFFFKDLQIKVFVAYS